MVLLQIDVRQLRSPTKMAATVQLRCYWKQLWSRWAITGSWEPLVSLWLEILSWFLVYGCILMSLYRSSLHFVPVQWFLAELWPLDTMIWDNDLIFGMRVYNHKLQINFEICSGWMIFGQLTAVGLCNLQGFQSGPVPGTFTRLRSCIVPAEITEPPKISSGQNHKYDGR